MTTFSAETYQNEFLSQGSNEVNAIVSVSATGGGAGGGLGGLGGPEAVEIIVIDTSGSMEYPPAKIRAAIEATSAAVDCIRDGVWFALVSGSHEARMIYPREAHLAKADDQTRRKAKQAVAQVRPDGGTAVGVWLDAANRLFSERPSAIHHLLLLTDGKNEGQRPGDLDAAISRCVGRYQADCRGVGSDWDVAELRKVSSALLGSVDIIANPSEMALDFTKVMETAMGKAVGSVNIRLWTPQGSRIKFVKQVAPDVEDLTHKRINLNPLTGDYPTGSWGEESRDYHVCIEVNPGHVGDEMLAGRVSLVVDDDVVSQSLVKAVWTDDVALSTRINNEVAHYTGQAELAQVIQEGLEARKYGNEAEATMKLGRAVQLAASTGNEGTQRLLRKVVEVEDEKTGTVRLKRNVEATDEMALDTRSTKTVRVKRVEP